VTFGKPHIPFVLPLSPLQLVAGKTERSFPFSAPRASYFYLARNGIWHGVDALGLEPGDEVLMPAYHHGVEVEVLKSKGLEPRYYGIDDRFQLDPGQIESLISKRTRLLYVIHYLGFPQPIGQLTDLARRHGLALFEDCALSLFSAAPEGPLGSHGDVSIFCLYKSLPTPHGGVMVFNRPDITLPDHIRRPNIGSTAGYIANRLIDYHALLGGRPGAAVSSALRSLARVFKRASQVNLVPIDTNRFEPEVVDLGVSRATHHIIDRTPAEQVVQARRENFEHLHSLLAPGVRGVIDTLPPGVCPLSYPVLVRDKPAVHARLLAEGLDTVTFWSIDNPDIPRGRFPHVDFLRSHLLEVPIHQVLRPRHVEYVARMINRHAPWDAS